MQYLACVYRTTTKITATKASSTPWHNCIITWYVSMLPFTAAKWYSALCSRYTISPKYTQYWHFVWHLLWFDIHCVYPYPSGLLHCHCGDPAAMPAKQTQMIWVNQSVYADIKATIYENHVHVLWSYTVNFIHGKPWGIFFNKFIANTL